MRSKKIEPLQNIVRKLLFSQQAVFIAVILVFILFASFWGVQKQISGQIYADHLLSERVGDYINTATSDLQTLTYMPAGNNSLSVVGKTKNYFDVLYFISADGILIGGYPSDPKFPIGRDMSSAPFYIDGQVKTTLSRPFISPSTGNPTIFISMPAPASNSIIVGELSLAGLQETLVRSQINPLGIFYITDDDGYLLAYPQYKMVQEHVDIRNTGILDKAENGKSVQINYVGNKFVLDVVQQNPTTGYWTIVEASIMAVLGPFLFPSLIGLALITILVFILFRKERKDFTNRIVRPLIQLKNEAQLLSTGSYTKTTVLDDESNSYLELIGLASCFETMREAIKSREMALANERNLLRTLIDHLPDAVYTKDTARRKTLSNIADVKVCGKELESDILGKKDEEIFSSDAALRSKKIDQQVLERGKTFINREVLFSNPSGQQIWLSTSKIPLFDSENKIIGMVGIGHDITERKKSEREIIKLNEELEQRVKDRTRELETVNQELESFSYSVSHDLRAPLRALDGYSSIIQQDYADRLDENGQALFQNIRTASQRMSKLIDDLLKLSKISRTRLNIKNVDLASIARDIFNQLRYLEPDRQVELIIEDKLIAKADQDLISIAFENLLRNAWKFTGKKSHARIEVGHLKQNGKKVYFIKDNGAGFSMAYRDKLFGAFQRLHSDTEFEGTGIGLAIVKRIITNHGGEIWAEGIKGKGATFYFTLD